MSPVLISVRDGLDIQEHKQVCFILFSFFFFKSEDLSIFESKDSQKKNDTYLLNLYFLLLIVAPNFL